jgi:hypothetical protein
VVACLGQVTAGLPRRLEEELVAGGGDAVGGAVQDVDGTGIDSRADILVRDADREV